MLGAARGWKMTTEPLPPVENYQYQSLDTTKRQIRLIRIISSLESSLPSCEISSFDLHTAPPYIAVSYTWDTESVPKGTIKLNGKIHDVGQTVCDLIHQFRTSATDALDSWLWTDQLCIDQSNIQERNHQIPLMSTIYSKCRYVLCWLGCHFVSHFALIDHRYFTRMWIVQEVLLAPEIHILCDAQWISWPEVRDTIVGSMNQNWLPTDAVANLLLHKPDHPKPNLIYCIRGYYDQKCRDPRDKVYGLLGIIPEEQRPPVDYAKSVIQVFVDAAQACHEEWWHGTTVSPIHRKNQVMAKALYYLAYGMGVETKSRNLRKTLDSLEQYRHSAEWFQSFPESLRLEVPGHWWEGFPLP